MPQIDNKDILGCILRSTINVIGRRTSESYANVFISNALKELSEKYSFLQFIKIKGKQYNEAFEIINIDSEVNNIETKEIGKATNELMIIISKTMGKNAGYYFIREIKEALPIDYEIAIKQLGVDLDLLQLQYVTETKEKFKFHIKNYDVLIYSIKALFDILDREFDKDTAIRTLDDLIARLRTQYEVLRNIEINDIRSIQGVDPISVNKDVNSVDAHKVGESIQKVFQELNKYFNEKSSISLVNETTTQSYAILLVNNVLRKYEDRYQYLEHVKIDGNRFSEGFDAIVIPEELNTIRPSEIGRGIRKIIEDIISCLGEDAGSQFVEHFKKRIGKAYLLRIEEIGVNLHLIELKQNLNFSLR